MISWVDGSYRLSSCEGRTGWELQVIDESEIDLNNLHQIPNSNVVAWRSRRQQRKLASSSSSELMSLVESVKKMPLYTRHIEKLWGVEPQIYFLTDSEPLLGWLAKKYITEDPKLQGMLDLVLDRLEDWGNKANVLYIQTKFNRADKHTKFVYAS